MEGFVKGDVVVVSFPFSDLSSEVRRPAVVVADPKGNSVILCPITKVSKEEFNQVRLSRDDLIKGDLKFDSFIQSSILITLHNSKIKYKIDSLKDEKINELVEMICEIIRQ